MVVTQFKAPDQRSAVRTTHQLPLPLIRPLLRFPEIDGQCGATPTSGDVCRVRARGHTVRWWPGDELKVSHPQRCSRVVVAATPVPQTCRCQWQPAQRCCFGLGSARKFVALRQGRSVLCERERVKERKRKQLHLEHVVDPSTTTTQTDTTLPSSGLGPVDVRWVTCTLNSRMGHHWLRVRAAWCVCVCSFPGAVPPSALLRVAFAVLDPLYYDFAIPL